MTTENKMGEAARTSLDLSVPPPSYEPRKYNIQPREEEGKETLPAYSSAISLENVLMRKMEFEGAFHRAQDRKWSRVYASLQGTALVFHKHKGSGPFGKPMRNNDLPDLPSGSRRGVFLKSYNLQYADVGTASDYYKKCYVIRVRAEADQFLLSCNTIETFIHWLQSLYAAIDLAPPLEDREIPRDISMPRSRRRRREPSHVDDNTVAAQREIIRTQFPRLGETATTPPPAPTPTGTAEEFLMRTPSTRENWFVQRAQQAFASIDDLEHHPSIVPETGKWQPEHQWSMVHDLIYAKRCFAVLTLEAPRKTNLVIMKGKQWAVDWATGTLTRCAPPDYGEVEMEKEGSLYRQVSRA